jgi:serine/threonine protein phosphatase PrpC
MERILETLTPLNLQMLVRDALYRSFDKTEIKADLKQEIDTFTTGCTLTTIMVLGNQLIAYNLGDIKAFLISQEEERVVITDITKNHSPHNPKEQ